MGLKQQSKFKRCAMVTTWHIRKRDGHLLGGVRDVMVKHCHVGLFALWPETPRWGWDGLKFGYPLVAKAAIFSICPFNEDSKMMKINSHKICKQLLHTHTHTQTHTHTHIHIQI